MGLPTDQEPIMYTVSQIVIVVENYFIQILSRYMYMYILGFFKNAIAVIFDRAPSLAYTSYRFNIPCRF